MKQLSAEIQQYRRAAAEVSGGTSSDAIYSMVEQVIAAKDLTGRILDYGAGVGDFSRRLLALRRFAQVTAVDIMPAPADFFGRVRWIEQDLNFPLPDADSEFDVVVAAEVIEHLENPRFMMRELFHALRPGGTAIVTTPNNESWRAIISLLVRGHYVAHDDSSYPAHITALLRKDLTRIFQETGFSLPKFYFSDEGGVPGAPETKWQKISFGSLRGLRFSDNLLAIANKI